MVEFEDSVKIALAELRKNNEKRKFEQTIDLLVNLKKFDVRKESLNLFVSVPHKIKDKKVCAFFESKSESVETITTNDFKRYKDKREIKKLAKKFDFFIAQASLMPIVATNFGKVLGPMAKMPSPQLGILPAPNDKLVQELVGKINKTIKVRSKEASLKFSIGRENMNDSEVIENIIVTYNTILKSLSKGRDNIRNVKIKFTMSHPVKINIDSLSNINK